MPAAANQLQELEQASARLRGFARSMREIRSALEELKPLAATSPALAEVFARRLSAFMRTELASLRASNQGRRHRSRNEELA